MTLHSLYQKGFCSGIQELNPYDAPAPRNSYYFLSYTEDHKDDCRLYEFLTELPDKTLLCISNTVEISERTGHIFSI